MMADQKSKKSQWVIFTDGASSGNPGSGGWGAIVCSPFGEVIELGGRVQHTTNNRMELTAIIQALETIEKSSQNLLQIYTDSTYVIRGATQWIWGWKKRGWITADGKPVANAELWQHLSSLTQGRKVEWHYVRGHQGIPGNERADTLAVQFSQGNKPHLFHGPLAHYPVALLSIPENTDLPESSSSQESKKPKKAYSYLSCVDHKIKRHLSWSECEQRVKGRAGAKFKKATSPEDELLILKSWGFSPDDLPQS